VNWPGEAHAGKASASAMFIFGKHSQELSVEGKVPSRAEDVEHILKYLGDVCCEALGKRAEINACMDGGAGGCSAACLQGCCTPFPLTSTYVHMDINGSIPFVVQAASQRKMVRNVRSFNGKTRKF
jgi:hypothetical protein